MLSERLQILRRRVLAQSAIPGIPAPGNLSYADHARTVELYLNHCAVDWSEGDLIPGGPAPVPPEIQAEIDRIITAAEPFPSLPESLTRPVEAGYLILCGNHAVIGYRRLLREGLNGLADRLEERLARADESERPLLCAWQRMVAAYRHYLRRCGARARECGEEQIAGDCFHLADHPAETFSQACRMLYFAYFFAPDSPGRVDQLLIDYYKPEEEEFARELLGCLWIRYFATFGKEHLRGGITHLALGGRGGFNALTRLCLEVADELALLRPQIAVRCYDGMDREFLKEALKLLRHNFGSPDFCRDDAIIPALEALGIAPEDAGDYCPSGCHEIMIPGRSHMGALTGEFNLPKLLRAALGLEALPGGRTLAAPGSWQEVCDNWAAALDDMALVIHRVSAAIDRQRADTSWQLAVSLFTDDCIERARTIAQGGAVYNFCNWDAIGLAETADSLAALRRHPDRLPEFRLALENDWKGFEQWRASLDRELPRFGNDCPEVDAIACDIIAAVALALRRHTPFRGGSYTLGTLAGYENAHAVFGAVTGATPDGRRAGEAFAATLGPGPCRDRSGVTAMLNSVAKIPKRDLPTSTTVNIAFDPALLADDAGLERVAALLAAHFHCGGIELQPTVVDRGVLLDARQHPERYPDLTVRVAGYSARFASLDPDVQDEVIRRQCVRTAVQS